MIHLYFIFDKNVEKVIVMSETWRERLSRRRLEIGIDGPEYDYIQKYIEFYCSEADRRCREIDMDKTVDEVIDSMKDKEFDRFTKGIIDSIHKKRGYDPRDESKGIAPLTS